MKNSIFCLQLQYSLLFTLKTKFVLVMVKPGHKHKLITKQSLHSHPQFVLQEVHLMRKYLVAVNKERHCFCQNVQTGDASLSSANHVVSSRAV